MRETNHCYTTEAIHERPLRLDAFSYPCLPESLPASDPSLLGPIQSVLLSFSSLVRSQAELSFLTDGTSPRPSLSRVAAPSLPSPPYVPPSNNALISLTTFPSTPHLSHPPIPIPSRLASTSTGPSTKEEHDAWISVTPAVRNSSRRVGSVEAEGWDWELSASSRGGGGARREAGLSPEPGRRRMGLS